MAGKLKVIAVFASIVLPSLLYFLSVPVASVETETPVSLGVDVVLSLSVSPESGLAIPLTPSAGGVYSTRDLAASVATNNITGFKLAFSAGSGGTSLINSLNNETNTLSPTGGSITSPSTINTNTWGFAVPLGQASNSGLFPNDTPGFGNSYSVVTSVATLNEAYATIPANNAPITLKTTSSFSQANDATNVFFGVHVNTAVPAGSYKGTVVFSAVANYVAQETPIMQEFTASACNAMTHGETIEMKDKRDDNIYTVAKIGDKCWMAESLSFGDPLNSTALSPSTSDVSSSWTLPPAITNGTSSADGVAQWIPADADGNAYCASNNCGYLYNWYAATAGTGVGLNTLGEEAQDSICPANWKLPGFNLPYEQLVEYQDVHFIALYNALGGVGVGGTDITDMTFLTGPPWSAVMSGGYYDILEGQGESVGYLPRYSAGTNDTSPFLIAPSQNIAAPFGAAARTYESLSIRCIFSL